MTEGYKTKVLEFLRDNPNGVPMAELRSKFPRVPLREMEKEDGTIEYSDNRWHISESALDKLDGETITLTAEDLGTHNLDDTRERVSVPTKRIKR